MSRRANRQHQQAAQQPPPPRQRQRRHNNNNNINVNDAAAERERGLARAESLDSSEMTSCVSSVGNGQEEATSRYARSDSPEETSSAVAAAGQMMVMGCHRCMMYVMMTEDGQPRCPKCGSTVLLDLQEKTQGKRRVY